MKKFSVFMLSCLCMCASIGTMFASATAGDSKIYDGNLFLTWVSYDDSGFGHVWAATGPIDGDPATTWTPQEISVGGASDSVTPPILFIDETTETVLALWEYFDSTNSTMLVAGATTVGTGGVWTSQLISDQITEYSGDDDQLASINEDGTILVTWTAWDLTSGNPGVRAAIATMSDGTVTWGDSFLIPGGGFGMAASKAAMQKNKAGVPLKQRQLALQKRQALVAKKPAPKPQLKKLAPKTTANKGRS